MSFLTYQVIYLIWMQLETEEIKHEMQSRFWSPSGFGYLLIYIVSGEATRLEKHARELAAVRDSREKS